MTFQGKCAHCGSMDVMAATDHWQCLDCGFRTGADNVALAPPQVSPDTTWAGRRNVDGGKYDALHGEE